ncbi:MAG: methyltransferase domain-containing protein [Ignavibacteriae bacterium]|nr:methyltransferase domain-containing protein [Ignavibacteriota bacterium]
MKNINNAGIIKRYNRYSRFYNLLEAPMELLFSKWRKDLIQRASGKILEVGVGTGKNLGYYPADADLTAIDFSKGMLNKAKKRWGNHKNIKFEYADIQKTNYADNSFDTVLESYVFCSVPDPIKGLNEIKRICKNDGKILLLEHVRSDNKILASMMDIFNPIVLNLFGYNINRVISESIKSSEINSFIEIYLWKDIFRMYIITNNK